MESLQSGLNVFLEMSLTALDLMHDKVSKDSTASYFQTNYSSASLGRLIQKHMTTRFPIVSIHEYLVLLPQSIFDSKISLAKQVQA